MSRAMYRRSATSGSRTWPRNSGSSYQSSIVLHLPMPERHAEPLTYVDAVGSAQRKASARLKELVAHLPKQPFRRLMPCSMLSKLVTTSSRSEISASPSVMTFRDKTRTPYFLCTAKHRVSHTPINWSCEVVDYQRVHSQCRASNREQPNAAADVANRYSPRVGTVQGKPDVECNARYVPKLIVNQF